MITLYVANGTGYPKSLTGMKSASNYTNGDPWNWTTVWAEDNTTPLKNEGYPYLINIY